MMHNATTEIKVRIHFGELTADAQIAALWERLRPHLEVMQGVGQTIQPSYLRCIQQAVNFRPRPGHAPKVSLIVGDEPELIDREIRYTVWADIEDVPADVMDDLVEEAASYALTVERHIDAWLESMLLGGFGRVNVEAQTPEPSEASAIAFAEQEERHRAPQYLIPRTGADIRREQEARR